MKHREAVTDALASFGGAVADSEDRHQVLSGPGGG
jgi:hypothetical protein